MFSSSAQNTFLGVAFVAFSVIFLLSGLRLLWGAYPIISYQLDAVLSFIFMAVGLALIFSQANKPGEGKK